MPEPDKDGEEDINDQLILIAGESGSGKSASLRNIRDQADWLYLNAEAGKRLPFKNNFRQHKITDPYQVTSAFLYAQENPGDVKGIIIDTLTFLLDMYESQYIYNSPDGRSAWAAFQQFFKELMQEHVAKASFPVIILAHTRSDLDEKNHEMRTSVPVKGALKNNGIEAYFSTVVAAKKMPVKELDDYTNNLLTITDQEKLIKVKHVFQTQLTAKTTGERIRSPMGLFSPSQTFIDNDAQLLLDYLNEYYSN